MVETRAVRFILDYFQKNLSKGYKLDDLKWMLLKEGYARVEIEEAMKIMREKIRKSEEESEKNKRLEEQKNIKVEIISEPEKKGFWGRLFGG